ncbi:MAG: SRPBCC family protein [Planctomycetota bacterium]
MELRRTIDIHASPERVWAVMADVTRWPEWTASVTSVELLDATELRMGGRAAIRQPKLPPATFTVTALEANRGFTWQTGNAVVRATARHEIEPTPEGSRVTLAVRFGGLLGWLMGRPYRTLTLQYLEMEAEGLKAESEREAG